MDVRGIISLGRVWEVCREGVGGCIKVGEVFKGWDECDKCHEFVGVWVVC